MSGDKLLTKKQEQLVIKTWSVIAEDLKGNAIKIFLHLFDAHPHYQKLFKGFADIPRDELANNRRFKAHTLTAITAVNTLVDSLDDPEVLTELLLKTGQNHIKTGLKLEDFMNLKACFLTWFPMVLGDIWNSEADEAWDLVLGFVMNTIGEGLDSLS